MIGLPYAVHALVLLRGEEGADLDGGAEVHALRADDIAGERVSDIGAFLSLRLHLAQCDLEDARMRLAVAGDARKRDVLKVVTDAVGLQHIEYRIQRSGVRDDAQAVSLVFQFLERLLDARAQLAMVIGDLPQASHILGVACDFFLVQIELGQPEEALVIPRGDFIQATGGQWIYKLTESGTKARKTPVSIGRQNPQQYEITGGLQPGDKVIVTGYSTFGDAEELILK